MYGITSTTRALDDHAIARIAPSVFADAPADRCSDRYLHIKSVDLLNAMRREGFVVTAARESRTRDDARRGFTRHELRFRHESLADQARTRHLGMVTAEVILTNSHDGSSCFVLEAGMFRLVCLNGLTVPHGPGSVVRVRHVEKAIPELLEGSYTVLEDAKKSVGRAEAFAAITLSRDEQHLLAHAAHQLRFEPGSNMATAINPDRLLNARRTEDRGDDLWRTFNRLQENVVRGGVHGIGRDATGKVRRTRSREVTGIPQLQGLNRQLWQLAEGMAKLKNGEPIDSILAAAA
jgi:hypothetical protein